MGVYRVTVPGVAVSCIPVACESETRCEDELLWRTSDQLGLQLAPQRPSAHTADRAQQTAKKSLQLSASVSSEAKDYTRLPSVESRTSACTGNATKVIALSCHIVLCPFSCYLENSLKCLLPLNAHCALSRSNLPHSAALTRV